MKKRIFTGTATAIVTPFAQDRSVDYPALERLLEFQIKNGINAIVVCGTTGEASTLSDDEHRKVIEFAIEKVKGRVPVIAGVGSNDTAYAVELSKFAESAGADALLHVNPYYNKTSHGGLIKHYFTIADSTGLPVMIYNVPSRTGMNITPAAYKDLSKHENLVAVKEANGDMQSVVRTRALCGDDLDFYTGEDHNIVTMLSLGGYGAVSVLSNILPKETGDICRFFFEGKIKESAALQIKYSSLIDALFCEPNPIPVKTAMMMMGLCGGHLRLPLCEMDETNAAGLRKAMTDVGIKV